LDAAFSLHLSALVIEAANVSERHMHLDWLRSEQLVRHSLVCDAPRLTAAPGERPYAAETSR
jgi:hypothetical protein